MVAGDALSVTGRCVEMSRSTYRVACDFAGQERVVLAKLSGRLNHHHIRVVVGDEVTVEVSPYDLTRGRITRRL
jgi:translation initiation factor IF-1